MDGVKVANQYDHWDDLPISVSPETRLMAQQNGLKKTLIIADFGMENFSVFST